MRESSDALARAIERVGGVVSQGDLSRRWNLSRSRVSILAADPTFPEPVADVGEAPVWAFDEVDDWREARKASRRAQVTGSITERL